MHLLPQLTHWLLASAEAHGAEASEISAALTQPQNVVHVNYLWLIPFFPILGATFNAFFGKTLQAKLGKKVTSSVAIGAMIAAFAVALFTWVQMIRLPAEQRYLSDHLWNMFTTGVLRVDFAFAVDPLSMMMVLIITFIGMLIHIYSTGYMADEPSYWKFFCYLNLFVFMMLLLVMGDNFVLMFFGWEGVGLASYLLIGFWYQDIEKASAAMKAFVTNRFGDFGFILGLFLLFWSLGGFWGPTGGTDTTPGSYKYMADSTLTPKHAPATPEDLQRRPDAIRMLDGVRVGPTVNFRELRDQIAVEGTGARERLLGATFFGMPVLALIGILMFIGATAKSAQIPLYVWLPDAMAGPTPVSALIHAATMVTAGVYMIARLNFIFSLSEVAMTVIAVTGAVTAMFAASIGFVQNDIKKVLAYSTVSQLGFMFIGVGVGAYWAGVYHLLTHAFFKACLFLGSGSVILGCHHEQDMRKMGGLKKYMPITRLTYLYACIAIAGFPIANGFFSKDEILWKAFNSGHNLLHPMIGQAVWLIGWFTALGTSFYMWRSYYMTFTGTYRGGEGHAHEDDEHDSPTVVVPALVTHSVGAAHAATFDHDTAHGGHGNHDDHGGHGHHGGTPHESPLAMTGVLATLAVGCALTVILGFWPPLGHLFHIEWMTEPLLEHWLNPVIGLSAPLVEARSAGYGAPVEWALIVASVGVATLGWYIARTLYLDAKSTIPETLAAKYPGVHRVVFNKYYVDELYQATVIKGSLLLGRAWSVFDRVVIDGAVNGVAVVVRFVCNIESAIDKYLVDGAVTGVANMGLRVGRSFRRLQTGHIQHYLYAALAGALLVVGINYLIRGS